MLASALLRVVMGRLAMSGLTRVDFSVCVWDEESKALCCNVHQIAFIKRERC